MYSVVLLADLPAHARLVADAIDREAELAVSAVGIGRGFPAALSRVARARLAAASVVVYVPAEPLEEPLWAGTEAATRPPVVLYDCDGRVDVLTALKLGARGYVGVREPEALGERTRQAAAGRLAVPPDTAAEFRWGLHTVMREDPRVQRLTADDIRMLRRLADGDTMRQVATEQKVTERTIYYRFESIRAKLGVKTTREALALVSDAGLLSVEAAKGPSR